ncbi:MAG: helix-turn-helix domain-containing protein, partial [Planctomycetota bacterium]
SSPPGTIQPTDAPSPAEVRRQREKNRRSAVRLVERGDKAFADGDTIEPRHLPPNLKAGDGDASSPGPAVEGAMSLDQLEKQAIRNALQSTSGNREHAAKILGIGERTLYRKLKEYGLK